MARGGLQALGIAGGVELQARCGADGQRVVGFQQALRLPRHRCAAVDQLHLRPEQGTQFRGGKRVVGAAQHQRVDLSGFMAKLADSPCVFCAERFYFDSILALDGICQAVAGLQDEVSLALQGIEQDTELGAFQRAARGHDADAPGLAQLRGRLERRFDTDDGQLRVLLAQQLDGAAVPCCRPPPVP